MDKEYLLKLATDQVKETPWTSFLKVLLFLLSLLYGIGVRAVYFAYFLGVLRRHSLPRPVISIGNMTLGGVGKTPCVEMLADYFKKKGLKPAVLIRGYMEKEASSQNSDEALMLKEELKDIPVLIGRDRVQSAQRAMAESAPDIILLDDGFQHWRLKRDLDIVLIDATNPFGNKHLIPRGILREPLSALKRAHIFVLTKTDIAGNNTGSLKNFLSKTNPSALIVEAVHKPCFLTEIGADNTTKDLSFLRHKTIIGLSSIGDPSSFENSLRQLDARIFHHFTYLDHHPYTNDDIELVTHISRLNSVSYVVTTQKDKVKLTEFLKLFSPDLTLLSLKVTLEITKGKDEFQERISGCFNR